MQKAKRKERGNLGQGGDQETELKASKKMKHDDEAAEEKDDEKTKQRAHEREQKCEEAEQKDEEKLKQNDHDDNGLITRELTMSGYGRERRTRNTSDYYISREVNGEYVADVSFVGKSQLRQI